jgi:P27 family predicted phage terminase small subunit
MVKGVRPNRINKAEAALPAVLPDPPDHLGAEAREEWGRVATDLHAVGLLTKIDRAILAEYCVSYGRWVIAERIIAADAVRDPAGAGLLATTSNGTKVQSPAVGIARRAMHDVARYATELGMTPSARSRVTAVPPPDPDDPAARYFLD